MFFFQVKLIQDQSVKILVIFGLRVIFLFLDKEMVFLVEGLFHGMLLKVYLTFDDSSSLLSLKSQFHRVFIDSRD
jgi:hypothetical protein